MTSPHLAFHIELFIWKQRSECTNVIFLSHGSTLPQVLHCSLPVSCSEKSSVASEAISFFFLQSLFGFKNKKKNKNNIILSIQVAVINTGNIMPINNLLYLASSLAVGLGFLFEVSLIRGNSSISAVYPQYNKSQSSMPPSVLKWFLLFTFLYSSEAIVEEVRFKMLFG